MSDHTGTSGTPTTSTRPTRPYDDIPGTYVFDGRHHRSGYALNMFCMSLNEETNRDAFRSDPAAYLDRFTLTPAQRAAVEARDWLELLRLGGNIYYTFKLAIFDGLSMQDVGAMMSGVSTEEFSQMMIDGGRSIDGNRSTSERTSEQASGQTGEQAGGQTSEQAGGQTSEQAGADRAGEDA